MNNSLSYMIITNISTLLETAETFLDNLLNLFQALRYLLSFASHAFLHFIHPFVSQRIDGKLLHPFFFLSFSRIPSRYLYFELCFDINKSISQATTRRAYPWMCLHKYVSAAVWLTEKPWTTMQCLSFYSFHSFYFSLKNLALVERLQ